MERLIVFYDEACGFCQAARRGFLRIRRREADVAWRPLSQAPACGRDGHACADAMKAQAADGTLHEGFFAARALVGRTRLFFLKPLLHVPGVPWLGRKAYAWVARNRHRLGPGPDPQGKPQAPASPAQVVAAPLNLRRHPKAEPVQEPQRDPRLWEGVEFFNKGEHWHAHEAWEPLWMGLAGDEKLFAQGLIMAAALLVQHGKRVERGVANHWANVQARLSPHAPAKWGLDVAGLLAQLEPLAADAGRWRLDARTVRIRSAGP